MEYASEFWVIWLPDKSENSDWECEVEVVSMPVKCCDDDDFTAKLEDCDRDEI